MRAAATQIAGSSLARHGLSDSYFLRALLHPDVVVGELRAQHDDVGDLMNSPDDLG
jgi:hypothetical protein